MDNVYNLEISDNRGRKGDETMEKRMLAPSEVAEAVVENGVKKANKKTIQTAILGAFAGMFVAFGAHGYLTVMQTLSKNFDTGFAKFMGAAVFPVGIMLVIMAGAELFTGNNLMMLALIDKKIKPKNIFKNWSIIYLTNFIGSMLIAYLVVKAGLYKEGSAMVDIAIKVAKGKMSHTFSEALIRGILCNFMVVIAVWFSFAGRDVVSKIFALWFPIMLFVLSGFEHSIANMFLIPLGKMVGYETTWMEIFTKNLIPVTIGNIIGGGIVIPFAYHICFLKYKKTNQKSKKIKSA